MSRQMGTFMVCEGGDKSGKTTASQRIVERLLARGFDVLWTREPGGTPYAEEIRTIILSDVAKSASPETLLHLFFAARNDHLEQKVLPALRDGVHVVSDRFDASTYAYQIVAGERPDLEPFFMTLRSRYITTGVRPQYFYFDIDPAIAQSRGRREGDRDNHFDVRGLDFHRRLREGYRMFLERYAPDTSYIIDASQTPEEVELATLAHINTLLAA